MKLVAIKNEYTMFIIVVNLGTGSKVLKEAKEIGVSGGTIFLGKGTAKSHILDLLGLNEIKKEIVLIVSENQLENKLHEVLIKNFHLNKPNHGIAFSLPLNRVLGLRNYKISNNEPQIGGIDKMEYEVIFTIVDRGLADEVVDAAVSSGARGATIINARGAGSHEHSTFFSMPLEPEKEIVMILINKEQSDSIITAIKDTTHIEDPAKGIMFTMDVNETSGLPPINKD